MGSKNFIAFTGYVMLFLSAFLAAIMITPPFLIGYERPIPPPEMGLEFMWFLQHYGDRLLAIILIVFFALIGLQLLGVAGKTTPRVIPDEDRGLLEPLVREANKEAINQYVILSSLGGFTGTFQKIGFSGLPLATAMLTLLFCVLSFMNLEFIEFAKLTLGAFIGSFVQRSADTEKLRQVITKDGDSPVGM
ncbi:hypothetical protein [Pseudanabaena sp. FACHB-2040]|uniref:hypothetical protein n=1 Tax=Pseudanabaena sp. FACHB-2040 TaxID=2692859 RepID=UPI001688C98B|nr:hypothetical protein [Pseudanabaena sp. FACHB-2040]MBD2256634.1 hypothetical protein [Pseudanabaena sp. FACHB-2040]